MMNHLRLASSSIPSCNNILVTIKAQDFRPFLFPFRAAVIHKIILSFSSPIEKGHNISLHPFPTVEENLYFRKPCDFLHSVFDDTILPHFLGSLLPTFEKFLFVVRNPLSSAKIFLAVASHLYIVLSPA